MKINFSNNSLKFLDKINDNNFEIEFSNTRGETISTVPINAKDLLLLHYEVEAA